MASVCITLCSVILVALSGQVTNIAFAQSPDDGLAQAEIAAEEVGPVAAIKDAEHRLGATERIFLVENQWEFDRCLLLLPKLPKIDLQAESLLVIMSWKSRPQSLKSVRSEDDTLIIQIEQQKPPRGLEARFYEPPDFLVFKLPALPGTVRIERNGEPYFTILRGKALEERTAELWEGILRIHSGGSPTINQIVRYYKRLTPDTSEEEIKRIVFTDQKKQRPLEPSSFYAMLFRELTDIRARPAVPRIFDLIESMGPHDKAFDPAWKSVVGIGGSDVVAHCKKALKSWNPRSNHAAILILRDLGLPETRPLAHENLANLQEAVGRCALDLLRRLGVTKEDVPAMIRALEKIESYYIAPLNERPKVMSYSSDVGTSIMYALGSLGPEAQEALPILERFATDTRLPAPGFRPDAKKAIERIKPPSSSVTH